MYGNRLLSGNVQHDVDLCSKWFEYIDVPLAQSHASYTQQMFHNGWHFVLRWWHHAQPPLTTPCEALNLAQPQILVMLLGDHTRATIRCSAQYARYRYFHMLCFTCSSSEISPSRFLIFVLAQPRSCGQVTPPRLSWRDT